jgi:hypothetical protein
MSQVQTDPPKADGPQGASESIELADQFENLDEAQRAEVFARLQTGAKQPQGTQPAPVTPDPAPIETPPNPEPAEPEADPSNTPKGEKDEVRIRLKKSTLTPYESAVLEIKKQNPDLKMEQDFEVIDRMAREKAGLPPRTTPATQPPVKEGQEPKKDEPSTKPDARIQAVQDEITKLEADLEKAEEDLDLKSFRKLTEAISAKKREIQTIQSEAAQAAQEADALAEKAFREQAEPFRQKALQEYPEAEAQDSPLRQKVQEVIARYEKADDPILDSPRCVLVATEEAARELGILPLSQRKASAPTQTERFSPPTGQKPPSPPNDPPKIVPGSDPLAALESLPEHEQHALLEAALSGAAQTARR